MIGIFVRYNFSTRLDILLIQDLMVINAQPWGEKFIMVNDLLVGLFYLDVFLLFWYMTTGADIPTASIMRECISIRMVILTLSRVKFGHTYYKRVLDINSSTLITYSRCSDQLAIFWNLLISVEFQLEFSSTLHTFKLLLSYLQDAMAQIDDGWTNFNIIIGPTLLNSLQIFSTKSDPVIIKPTTNSTIGFRLFYLADQCNHQPWRHFPKARMVTVILDVFGEKLHAATISSFSFFSSLPYWLPEGLHGHLLYGDTTFLKILHQTKHQVHLRNDIRRYFTRRYFCLFTTYSFIYHPDQASTDNQLWQETVSMQSYQQALRYFKSAEFLHGQRQSFCAHLDFYSNGFISVYDAEMFGILRLLIAVNYCRQIILRMTRHQLVYTVLSVNLWFVTATRLTEIGPFLRSKSKLTSIDRNVTK